VGLYWCWKDFLQLGVEWVCTGVERISCSLVSSGFVLVLKGFPTAWCWVGLYWCWKDFLQLGVEWVCTGVERISCSLVRSSWSCSTWPGNTCRRTSQRHRMNRWGRCSRCDRTSGRWRSPCFSARYVIRQRHVLPMTLHSHSRAELSWVELSWVELSRAELLSLQHERAMLQCSYTLLVAFLAFVAFSPL